MGAVTQLFGVMMAIMLPVCMLIFILKYFKYKESTNAQLGKLKKELHLNSTKELKEEIVALKERIEVLERIVTDSSFEVERKISGLK